MKYWLSVWSCEQLKFSLSLMSTVSATSLWKWLSVFHHLIYSGFILCVCAEDSAHKVPWSFVVCGSSQLFPPARPSVELCCKFFSSSLYLFKPSDPVCVCSREYIQSTCGASPIHTDRGRSGWVSERLCGKSLSWPLNPHRRQTDGRTDRDLASVPPTYSSISFKCVFLWVHHQRDCNHVALFTRLE